ncbi:hypothetical protein HMPREF0294_2481 [Corynebacterium glucuronolyticum ATCC 51867]|uniref:Uncharacterized protein n=1 Tax=Corynebacterium glucuronolyticum ATCC 51866 TaxID=548478 RepID=A0ABM9XSH6_9CORY|nr:hypothetical protein HMPREF0294_2481 [Corynebacterium glucuronolyticum ATCC 51867]EEI64151.1 hypothetical protein HMPREF0293_0238 [Corynebacterium glucuronolyticum ATCC 51866]
MRIFKKSAVCVTHTASKSDKARSNQKIFRTLPRAGVTSGFYIVDANNNGHL